MKKISFTLLSLCLSPFSAFADNDDLKFSLTLSGSLSKGNTEHTMLETQFSAEKPLLKLDQSKLTLTTRYNDDGSDNKDLDLGAVYKYDKMLTNKKSVIFGVGSIHQLQSKKLDLNTMVLAGVGYDFCGDYLGDRCDYKISFGLGHEYKNPETDLSFNEVIASYRIKAENSITDQTTYKTSLWFRHPLYSDISERSIHDYTLLFTSQIKIKNVFRENSSLKIGLEDEYDNNPGTDVEKNDFRLKIGVGIEW